MSKGGSVAKKVLEKKEKDNEQKSSKNNNSKKKSKDIKSSKKTKTSKNSGQPLNLVDMPLKQKRIVAYIIQFILIVIIFLMLKYTLSHLVILVLSNNFLHIDLYSLKNLSSLSLSKETLVNMYSMLGPKIGSTFTIATFVTFYKKLVLAVIIYSLVVYTIVPLVIRFLFFYTGDVGKMVMYLEVQKDDERVSNAQSVSTSLAYKSYKVLYSASIFFVVTLPLYKTFPTGLLPNFLHLIFTLMFLASLIQVLFSLAILIFFIVNFFLDKDIWRSKKELVVVDVLQKTHFGEGMQVLFPATHYFVTHQGNSQEVYFALQQKALSTKKILDILVYIEQEQNKNKKFLSENKDKILQVLALIPQIERSNSNDWVTSFFNYLLLN
ncbi:MAG: hypothetical protein ACK5HR_01520 [Mycoplasmatales bacterium]